MQKGELREQRFQTGTVELNYAEGPATGEALLYLHGGDGRWQEGRALLEKLASSWHVYGLDLRGHGLSGRVPGAYRLQDYVPDVATFLEQVVNRPTVVIGHSMGGHVGIMLAARFPHLVRALIVGDSPPLSGHVIPAHAPTLQDALGRSHELSSSSSSRDESATPWQERPAGDVHPPNALVGLGNQEDVSRFRAKNLEHLDPEVIATVFDQGRINQGYDAHVLLPAIRCPVLLVQADPEAGGLTPHEEIAPALALLPRGKHVFLKGVSHAWLHDQPEQGRKAIADFLAAV